MSRIAIFGSYVLARRDGAQDVLRDHWVLLEGNRIAAVTPSRPQAELVFDRPGRFVLPGLLNLHNHCFSEAVARTHTEDGNGRRNNKSIIYTVLLPLTKRGIEILSPAERMDIARLGILQLLKGGATTVMEPFRSGIPEMFDAAAADQRHRTVQLVADPREQRLQRVVRGAPLRRLRELHEGAVDVEKQAPIKGRQRWVLHAGLKK